MHVELNTDNHVEGSQGLKSHVGRIVQASMGRFGERVTRVEVQLAGQPSAAKEGSKRCVMEARLTGLKAIAVTHEGETLDQALEGAADKLQRTLDRTLGRLDHRKGGNPPYSGFSTDNREELEPENESEGESGGSVSAN